MALQDPEVQNDNQDEDKVSAAPGQKTFHPVVFMGSSAIVFVILGLTLAFQNEMGPVVKDLKLALTQNSGWFFVLVVNVVLVFCLFLGFSRWGLVRLGDPDEKPEFSMPSWFSMLFSAGMGIGLLYYSVAEPVSNFANSPHPNITNPADRAETAMIYTYLNWGLHAWAVYALLGLCLAYFCFTRKLPLAIRSIFYPFFRGAIFSHLGDTIDILTILACLFGLATSLGLGVGQINAGLHYLLGVPISHTIQVILIVAITSVAAISIVSGLDKGVRFLSVLNIRIAGIFLLALLILGPTVFILDTYVQTTGSYFQNLLSVGSWTEAFQDSDWQSTWTLSYWAWWISWSPFVGIFIARISRGRTLREFVFGVLIVPTLLTFLWISAFGGSAIHLELNGIADITGPVQEEISTALFVLMEEFPLPAVTSTLGVALVTFFFITSSDSGSLVVDSLASGGSLHAPTWQRIYWAAMEGGVAAILLVGGGLHALQTATILTGLPFAFLLLFMCYSLYWDLKRNFGSPISSS